MRLVLGGFLIVFGLVLAVIGLDGGRSGALQQISEAAELLPSWSGEQHRLPVSTVVTLPSREPTAQSHARALSVVVASSGATLVSDLQQELKRVGCYDGPLTGVWSPQTRAAMAAVVERANAKLPTDRADPVLLALVKNHDGTACGSCPTGQEASRDGRCVPKGIAVHAASLQPVLTPPVAGEKPRAADVDVPQRSRRAARRAAREGRMGLGVPVAAPNSSNRISKIAAAEASPPDQPQAVQTPKDRRAARHANRRSAAHSGRYLRPMRSARYAYRPFGRPRGIAALLFGWF